MKGLWRIGALLVGSGCYDCFCREYQKQFELALDATGVALLTIGVASCK